MSLSGYAFTPYGNTMSWKSDLHSIVALSTTKDEYIVGTEVVKEPLWIKGFISILGISQEEIEVKCDNQSLFYQSSYNKQAQAMYELAQSQ